MRKMAVLMAVLGFVAGCELLRPSSGDEQPGKSDQAAVDDSFDEAKEALDRGGISDDDAGEDEIEGVPTAVITDPQVMISLEGQGYSFAERIGADLSDDSSASLAELVDVPAVAVVVETVEEDLAGFQAADPQLGVGVAGHPHRLFDPGWLRSESTHFELVAVMSRVDRRPFVEGACGEVRLVYRMAYVTEVGGESVASRLPLTVTLDWLEWAEEDEDCGDVARRWFGPQEARAELLLEWLNSVDGPLRAEQMTPERLHRLQINLQSQRWPSTVHPSLGGHVEYVLRSFVPDGEGRWEVEPLENTPDVEALSADDELRRELLEWLTERDHLELIDRGTVMIPERFLAQRAISVAPRGLARRGNRPFDQLFSPQDFGDVDFEGLQRVQSPAGLVRRLDDHSCAGCHQGRAVAGFHLLGEDRADTSPVNSVALQASPHALDEHRRRAAILAAQAAGDEPHFLRPFSERDQHRSGVYGTPCGLGSDPTFSTWDCAEGLECRPYDEAVAPAAIGICLPKRPSVGDPCQVGTMRTRSTPVDDRIVGVEQAPCPSGAVCNTNAVGFPGGMCTTSCASPGDDGRCGAIAVLDTFNQCLAEEIPFERCLKRFVNPAGLRACDEDNPCRHDYLCAQNADRDGVCIPPYFLFQMRVDGHP